MPRKVVDLAGQVFGRLTVAERIGSQGNDSLWLCRCECGETKGVASWNLRSGRQVSCGCLRSDVTAARHLAARVARATTPDRWGPRAPTNLVHGQSRHNSKSVEYRTWSGVLQRVTSSLPHVAPYYRDRGITVCERWRNSFEAFYADMGPRPPGPYTIDRINNDGNYEPGNCRWATWSQQNSNKRPRQKRAA